MPSLLLLLFSPRTESYIIWFPIYYDAKVSPPFSLLLLLLLLLLLFFFFFFSI